MEEVRAALEEEFGEMRYPMPKTPVFHQSLSSDAEFGRAALRVGEEREG